MSPRDMFEVLLGFLSVAQLAITIRFMGIATEAADSFKSIQRNVAALIRAENRRDADVEELRLELKEAKFLWGTENSQ